MNPEEAEAAAAVLTPILIAAVSATGYAHGSGEMFMAGPARCTQAHHISMRTLANHLRRFKFARELAERPRAHRCGRPTRSGGECQAWTLARACWQHDGMLPDKAVQTLDGELVDLGRRSGWVLLPPQPAVRARKGRKARKAKPERWHRFGRGPVESSLDNLLRELDWLTRHPDEQTDEQLLSIGRHAQRDLKTIQGRRARARRAVRRRGRMGRATVEKRMKRLLAEIEHG